MDKSYLQVFVKKIFTIFYKDDFYITHVLFALASSGLVAATRLKGLLVRPAFEPSIALIFHKSFVLSYSFLGPIVICFSAELLPLLEHLSAIYLVVSVVVNIYACV